MGRPSRFDMDAQAAWADDEKGKRKDAALRQSINEEAGRPLLMPPECEACGGYLLPCTATATGVHPKMRRVK